MNEKAKAFAELWNIYKNASEKEKEKIEKAIAENDSPEAALQAVKKQKNK